MKITFIFSCSGFYRRPVLWCGVGNTGVNLIKLLHLQFKSVAIVLESENNSYTCESHL